MQRRSLLSTLGAAGVAGLAGCLAGGNSGSHQRRVSVADQDSLVDDHAVRIAPEVLEPEITDEHTARVEITTTNEGPKRALSVDTGDCAPFNRGERGSDDPPGLWLHDPNRAGGIDRDDPRWVRDAPADRNRGFDAYGCSLRVYEPGESVATEYVVWDDYRVDGYLDPGTYRWETDVEIYSMDAVEVQTGSTARRDGDPDASVTWGFSLAIEDE